MKKGISQWAFTKNTLRDCMALAKDAGFEAIELAIAEEGAMAGEITLASTEADIRKIVDTAGDLIPTESLKIDPKGLGAGTGGGLAQFPSGGVIKREALVAPGYTLGEGYPQLPAGRVRKHTGDGSRIERPGRHSGKWTQVTGGAWHNPVP